MVGGLSLPNATKRDFQDTTELHCSERMRCKPSKITKIETKTCIFWWTKIPESPQLHSFRIMFFCKGIWWNYKMNGPARKSVKSLGILVVSFCFDAIGKHSAKYQVILSATLESCVNLNNTSLRFAVVSRVLPFRLRSSFRDLLTWHLKRSSVFIWGSCRHSQVILMKNAASKTANYIKLWDFKCQMVSKSWSKTILYSFGPKWSWCCCRSPMWLALPVEASKADGAGNWEQLGDCKPWIQGTFIARWSKFQNVIGSVILQGKAPGWPLIFGWVNLKWLNFDLGIHA